MQINTIIEGTVEKIAFGGDGIIRHEGLVIFVPFTAPQDLVSCRITEIKKSFAKAVLLDVLKPSPYRIKPACPYFGVCGGCQIQHLDDERQDRYKIDAVKDAFKRIGHLTTNGFSYIPAHLKWAYRRHVTLHLKERNGAFEAGYIGADNHSLIPVQACPIFTDMTDDTIKQIQQIVETIPNPQKCEGRLTVLKKDRNHFILSFNFPHPFKIDKTSFLNVLQRYPKILGIIVSIPGNEFICGDPYSEIKLQELTFRFTPQAFIQNHPEQSANIYHQICSLIAPKGQKKILDLYCGFGVTSLLLSKQGHIVKGIEYNDDAIRFAKDNAQLNRLSAHFIQGDVGKLLKKTLKEFHPDVVLMNPPRTGIPKTELQTILEFEPSEIIYVSCMPSTLARDLALLCQNKYEIKECAIYDMFPQTAHVETLVYLIKKS